MTELIELLALSLNDKGELHLNPEQAARLIRFMKTAHLAMKQQDVLVKNLKRMIEPEGQTHGPESET